MRKMTGFTLLLATLLAACGPIVPASGGSGEATPVVITAEVGTVVASTVGPPATQGPSPMPVPATLIPTLPSAALSPTEMKYKILDQFPDFFFCDPDFYPVAHADELILAQQRFPELQADREEFQAILNHNHLSGVTNFTDDQKLLVYHEHKKLNALYFDLTGNKYQFQIQTGSEGQQGNIITGTIDANGTIRIEKQEQGFPTCPICLAVGTLIDTPRGAIRVEELRVGDPIWTVNGQGERVQGKILRTSRVAVPVSHQVVHVVLSDGRELWASPGHPTANGQALGKLKAGDDLDGARVMLSERMPYSGNATYDLLPSGDTGFYWANGVLLGSTLSKR